MIMSETKTMNSTAIGMRYKTMGMLISLMMMQNGVVSGSSRTRNDAARVTVADIRYVALSYRPDSFIFLTDSLSFLTVDIW